MRSRASLRAIHLAIAILLFADYSAHAQSVPSGDDNSNDLARMLIVSSHGGANPPFTGLFVNDFIGANRWT